MRALFVVKLIIAESRDKVKIPYITAEQCGNSNQSPCTSRYFKQAAKNK